MSHFHKTTKDCDCGCPQKTCNCELKRYVASLRYPLSEIPKVGGVRVITHIHPLLIFEAKPCSIDEFGGLLGDKIERTLKGSKNED